MTPGSDAFASDAPWLEEGDALFAALDQQEVGEGGHRWTASVLRIHADERDWWIDVATAEDPAVSVLFRLSRRANPAHLVAALRGWRPTHENHRQIVKVMCLC